MRDYLLNGVRSFIYLVPSNKTPPPLSGIKTAEEKALPPSPLPPLPLVRP